MGFFVACVVGADIYEVAANSLLKSYTDARDNRIVRFFEVSSAKFKTKTIQVSKLGHYGVLATRVDRKSPYTMAVKVSDKSAETVTRATLRAMKKLPPEKIRTMTFDNGKEFAGFKGLERGLRMQSYFARPYPSWERGTNENTNGLLRQFFPKGMDFSTVFKTDVDRALKLLNNRPRKCLNYRTPTEVFWSNPKRCASD